jgi:serine protease
MEEVSMKSSMKMSLMAAVAVALAFAGVPVAVSAQSPALIAPQVTPFAGTERVNGFIVYLRDPGAVGRERLERSAAFARAKALGKTGFHHKRALATGGELFTVGDSGMSASAINAVMNELASDPSVAHVEPDIRMHIASTNDPRWPQQWALHDARTGIDAQVAWNRTRGAGSAVAVIDTGIASHEDLEGQLLPGYDFVSDAETARDGDGRDADPSDAGDWNDPGECDGARATPSSWHGTHVSGIIAARANNAVGISGVAPEAKVLPVRVLGKCGGSLADVAEAIIWSAGGSIPGAPDNPYPARVLNLSLGGFGACGQTMASAVARARTLGASVIVAAGNSASNVSLFTPANCPGVVAVAASGRDGSLANYSNFGKGIALTATGGSNMGVATSDIVSTVDRGSTVPSGSSYTAYAGTSMAAPHVAGVAALMLSVNPQLTPDQVHEYLIDTTRPMPVRCTKGCGTGLLDAGAAVDAVFDES